MRPLAFASDYDGTLATAGVVQGATLAALENLKQSGLKLLLVTGRELEDLEAVFPQLRVFDQVIAENGGLLFEPAIRETKPLAPPAPATLIKALRERGVAPLSVGRVLIATRQSHEQTVRDVIRELALEQRVILNRDALMVLPSGVDKGTGLKAALEFLGVPPAQCIGIGDAENDSAFLRLCGYSAVVANGLPELKRQSDWVSQTDNGSGVSELIELLLQQQLPRRK
jgi:hydroxymethylpyrimidine pyrophosphatase-like HAD family hydrolase